MARIGTLGIDAGTQGLSVVFVDEDCQIVATGEGHYEMLAGLAEGCYEQSAVDWESALINGMQDLRRKLAVKGIDSFEVDAIGISGQMHGEVLIDETGQSVGSTRLWCDARNEDEGHELTQRLGVKVPKRMTVARWLWTCRNDANKSKPATRLTTPAGWLAFRLTGQHCLGIGDASGMFPIDPSTLDFNRDMVESFDSLEAAGGRSVATMLPQVLKAGEDGGQLNQVGSDLLGLPIGIPVAPAEGDQPAALAGSMIAEPGFVAVSFGTSVCANSVGDRPFQGVSQAIDHFCAVDGRPINMVFLRNGTTFMNCVVNMFAENSRLDFGQLMETVVNAPAGCGGVLAMPFMDDEPGLGVNEPGRSGLIGFDAENATAGNAIKAALLATICNLKSGLKILDDQGVPRSQIVLTGGLTRTPELGQVVADVLQTPVELPRGADEGTAYGAALMAKFRLLKIAGDPGSWSEFLQTKRSQDSIRFDSDPAQLDGYEKWQSRYAELLKSISID